MAETKGFRYYPSVAERKLTLKNLVVFMVMSAAVNKTFMFYFGINYSQYPGRGYGWGLLITVVYMVVSAGWMIYKFRNTNDE